jgi:hypothetical protein
MTFHGKNDFKPPILASLHLDCTNFICPLPLASFLPTIPMGATMCAVRIDASYRPPTEMLLFAMRILAFSKQCFAAYNGVGVNFDLGRRF